MGISLRGHDTGIYIIECKESGKRYVGSAVSIKKRWREHRRQLEAGKHHSAYLLRAWAKRGAESFRFSIAVICARTDLLFYEQALIDALKPEYNSAPIAGSMLGFKHSPESRSKMRASRPKGFSPMKGLRHSDTAKQKISAGRKGKGGGARPPEWIASLCAAQKGRTVSPEHRAKIAATLTGHKQTPEQIEKRAQKLRGRKMPAGFAQAQSERRMGMKFSEEHCVSIGRSKAKLTDNDVVEIRAGLLAGEKQKDLAQKFGVDQSVISTIKTRTAYAWVD